MIKECDILKEYSFPDNDDLLPSSEIGKTFSLKEEAVYYQTEPFPAGTEVRFEGVRIQPTIKNFPPLNVFRFPDNSLRILDKSDIVTA